tara:strand:+ start:1966 stop:2424 length:459 start_codon:yes stop_codon:yes gene_type:complete
MIDTRFTFQSIKLIFCFAFLFSFTVIKAQNHYNPLQLIEEKMAAQEVCWNNGDLACFMEVYWKSDSLKFIGSKGLNYGWQLTLDNYKTSYPNKTTMGVLTFTNLHVEQLSEKYISVIGKWHLNRKMGNLEGHYSLIWEKINGDWVIISDHSS